jgi:hypothetical protein
MASYHFGRDYSGLSMLSGLSLDAQNTAPCDPYHRFTASPESTLNVPDRPCIQGCAEASELKGAAMVGLWQWIKNQIVQDVPEEIALCEFDCHKQQCTEREWQRCPRRIAWAGSKRRPAA